MHTQNQQTSQCILCPWHDILKATKENTLTPTEKLQSQAIQLTTSHELSSF